MLAPEMKELLNDTATLTEAVGRHIRSPKNDAQDIQMLIESLEHISSVLLSAKRSMIREALLA